MSLQWPQPILSLAEGKDKSKYCKFHQDHEHRTKECKHLKKQIETLIHQGKLQKFVQKMDSYGQQQRDEKDRDQETDNTKAPIGEIRMIVDKLVVGGPSKSPKMSYLRKSGANIRRTL